MLALVACAVVASVSALYWEGSLSFLYVFQCFWEASLSFLYVFQCFLEAKGSLLKLTKLSPLNTAEAY